MAYSDPEDQRRAARAHYEANAAAYKARAVAHTRKTRAEIRSVIHARKDRPCADCGQRYPFYVMQFDHVRGDKAFNLGHYASKCFSVAVALAEIAKCDVVCANCHAERTHQRGPREVLPADTEPDPQLAFEV